MSNSSATKHTEQQADSTAGARFIHLHRSDAMFCRSTDVARRFSLNKHEVDCPRCRERMEVNARFTEKLAPFLALEAATAKAEGR